MARLSRGGHARDMLIAKLEEARLTTVQLVDEHDDYSVFAAFLFSDSPPFMAVLACAVDGYSVPGVAAFFPQGALAYLEVAGSGPLLFKETVEVRARDESELSLPPIDPEESFSVDLAVISLDLIPTLSTEPADDTEAFADTTGQAWMPLAADLRVKLAGCFSSGYQIADKGGTAHGAEAPPPQGDSGGAGASARQ